MSVTASAIFSAVAASSAFLVIVLAHHCSSPFTEESALVVSVQRVVPASSS
jgi:hypothetical protein